MTYSYSFRAIYEWNARRQKTSCIKSKIWGWSGRIVKVHCGTEHDVWKDDDETETLSPPIEGRLHLEYTYRSTVWPFQQLSFKTNRPKTGWPKSHKPNIFWIAIPCCIQISLTLFDTLPRKEVGARRKRLTFDPPPSAVLKKFPALMTIGRKLEGRMVVVLVSSWSK